MCWWRRWGGGRSELDVWIQKGGEEVIVERMSSSSSQRDLCQLLETTQVIIGLCRWGGWEVVLLWLLFEIHFLFCFIQNITDNSPGGIQTVISQSICSQCLSHLCVNEQLLSPCTALSSSPLQPGELVSSPQIGATEPPPEPSGVPPPGTGCLHPSPLSRDSQIHPRHPAGQVISQHHM